MSNSGMRIFTSDTSNKFTQTTGTIVNFRLNGTVLNTGASIISVILKNNTVRRLDSITYSGFWSESNYLENHARLMGWVAVQKLKIKGEPIYARYNSPFSLWFLRRNEILIEVITPAN
jgi:hypothetical protein